MNNEHNQIMMRFLDRIEKHIERMADSNVQMAEKVSYFMGESRTDREALHKVTGEHREWLLQHDKDIGLLKKGEEAEVKKKGDAEQASLLHLRHCSNIKS